MFTRTRSTRTTHAARHQPQRSSIPLGAGPAGAMALSVGRQTRSTRTF